MSRWAKIVVAVVALVGATCGCYAQSRGDMEILRSAQFEEPRNDRHQPYGVDRGRQTLSPTYHAISSIWWVWQNALAPEVASPGGYAESNANYFKLLVEEYGLLRAIVLFPDRIVRNTKVGRSTTPTGDDGLIYDSPKRYRQ